MPALLLNQLIDRISLPPQVLRGKCQFVQVFLGLGLGVARSPPIKQSLNHLFHGNTHMRLGAAGHDTPANAGV